ncbi:MAG: hypothetical protein SFW35_07465 [Chitinophagales bacterium]|nr:hypothetical protein [Chitinophagales bacterium]
MYRYFILLFIVGFLASCNYREGLFEKKVDEHHVIKVTDYISRTDGLHPNAVFQYANRYRTVYLLVLDTTKSDIQGGLDAYAAFAVQSLASVDSSKAQIDTLKDVAVVNGMPARQYHIKLMLTGEETWFDLLVVEDKDRFYQILGWTISKRRSKYGKDIEAMVTSFTPK